MRSPDGPRGTGGPRGRRRAQLEGHRVPDAPDRRHRGKPCFCFSLIFHSWVPSLFRSQAVLVFGVVFNTANFRRLLDVGPPSDSPKAASFRYAPFSFFFSFFIFSFLSDFFSAQQLLGAQGGAAPFSGRRNCRVRVLAAVPRGRTPHCRRHCRLCPRAPRPHCGRRYGTRFSPSSPFYPRATALRKTWP